MTEDSSGILIRPFRPEDQAAVQGLILDGLVEHWGFLDPTKNPDLDDIASTYADGTFLVAWQGDDLVGTGALVREADGVARIVRMSVATHLRRRGIGTLILERLCGEAQAAGYAQIVLETGSASPGPGTAIHTLFSLSPPVMSRADEAKGRDHHAEAEHRYPASGEYGDIGRRICAEYRSYRHLGI